MSLQQKDFISIRDCSKEQLLALLHTTKHLKNHPEPSLLKGKIMGSCFFEPSTRTRLSFEAAMHRLGGAVIGFSDQQSLSIHKGESFVDTMKMIENYADVAVVRHPLEGAATLAAESMGIPVINAGDGAKEHPSQTLLDLFTILETQQTLDHLSIAFAGDLKYGRTVHSLALALVHFHCRLFFVSPPAFEMPKALCDELREKGVKFSFHQTLEEIISRLDILYVTRTQKERLPAAARLPAAWQDSPPVVTPELLEKASSAMRVLHPLPRTQEIDERIDEMPHAAYFQQAANGVFARQALLAWTMNLIA